MFRTIRLAVRMLQAAASTPPVIRAVVPSKLGVSCRSNVSGQARRFSALIVGPSAGLSCLGNLADLPLRVYVNEGIGQVVFLESDEDCDVSYEDRGGKYQGQTGLTYSRL